MKPLLVVAGTHGVTRMRPNFAPLAPIVPPLARAVLEALPEGVLVFDAAGRLLYANGSARGAVGHLADDGLRHRLLASGARTTPLRSGPDDFGEAVFLPADGAATLAERERRAIVQTLEVTRWKLAETARRLGISRTTLWRRLKAYGLSREDRPMV
jgi:transcriptional regulator of acetoin/glycerol metabolism